jgi:hypothetical protein
MWADEGADGGSGGAGKMEWIVRIAPCLLAHYFSAAYRYGSEELLRALRIAIRPLMFLQLRGIEDVTSAGDSADGWVPTGSGVIGVGAMARTRCRVRPAVAGLAGRN